jgi:hypothetical protein
MFSALHSRRCPFGTSDCPQVQTGPELLLPAPEQAAVVATPRNAIVDFQCLRIRFLRGGAILHAAYRGSGARRDAAVTTFPARLAGEFAGPGRRRDLVCPVTSDETNPQDR